MLSRPQRSGPARRARGHRGTDVEARHITLRPFGGLDFTRKDFLDLSFGVRLRLYQTFVFSLSGLYALNDDGLRSSQVSSVAALEVTF